MMNKYVITVSYGDYTIGVGGTDKAILSQQRILNSAGYNVVSLSPFLKTDYWDIVYNGKYQGIYSNQRIKSYLSKLHGKSLSCIFIHHLLSINTDLLDDILDYCDVPIIYYLHDYYTICPKSGLIREDGTFCGNGFPNDQKCQGCSFFEESKQLISKIKPLINKYEDRITFIAPSESAKKVWITDYPRYEDKVKVIYHQELIGEYTGNSDLVRDEEPLKIAFVGYQRPLKGWDQFKEAVESAQQLNANEKHYQFGWGDEKPIGIEQIDVDFKKSITAMTDKLREKAIHVAVIWSTCPETYSYTYYEALAANCFIITNKISGNICAQVKERNNGIAADDLNEVLCDEKKLRELVNAFRTNGHKTPDHLRESQQFLELINDCGRHLETVNEKWDISILLSIMKKTKRKILSTMKMRKK